MKSPVVRRCGSDRSAYEVLLDGQQIGKVYAAVFGASRRGSRTRYAGSRRWAAVPHFTPARDVFSRLSFGTRKDAVAELVASYDASSVQRTDNEA